MGPIECPKTPVTTNIRCETSQKSEYLVLHLVYEDIHQLYGGITVAQLSNTLTYVKPVIFVLFQ